ncbi:unnamed protein product [Haemonchus placei]|uniref:Ovule protein n=1 Tax=Haemonchus placei TaxID=6290 RepID=A0A0N4VV85_HAEPC|nr:unnamed protein product [Haemonchus placei]
MVPLDMEFRTTLLLSSSPYCKAIAVQPFKGAVPGDRLLFMYVTFLSLFCGNDLISMNCNGSFS